MVFDRISENRLHIDYECLDLVDLKKLDVRRLIMLSEECIEQRIILNC